MPYRCVHCTKVYADGSAEILTGCSSCKSKFFFYIKDAQLKQILGSAAPGIELNEEEKEELEKDVREIAGVVDEEAPVFLDFESVKIVKPGKYLLDLSKLFARDKPKVYKLEDGKYIIDLVHVKPTEE